MILSDPQDRKGLRSVFDVAITLFLLWLVWQLVERLTGEEALREVGRWALGIIALGRVGYIVENGIRSFKGEAFGARLDITGNKED